MAAKKKTGAEGESTAEAGVTTEGTESTEVAQSQPGGSEGLNTEGTEAQSQPGAEEPKPEVELSASEKYRLEQGRKAYESHVEKKPENVRADCPKWEDLPEARKAAWVRAAL